MPYRGRAINWNLLLEPTMQGLSTEANASARLGSTIERGGGAVGQGFKDKRTEAESKRRFDSDLALRQKESDRQDAELRLKQDDLAFKERERQGFDSDLVDRYQSLADMLTKSISTGGEPDRAVVETAQQVDDILKSKGIDPLGVLKSRAEKASEIPSVMRMSPGDPINEVGQPGDPGWPKNRALGDMTPWRTTGTVPAAKPPPMVPGMENLRAGAQAQAAAAPRAPLTGEFGVEVGDSVALSQKAGEIQKELDALQAEAKGARRTVDSRSIKSPEAKAAAARALSLLESRIVTLGGMYKSYESQARHAAKAEGQAETQALETAKEAKAIQSEKAAYLANGGSPADVKRGEQEGIADSASWRWYLNAKAADARDLKQRQAAAAAKPSASQRGREGVQEKVAAADEARLLGVDPKTGLPPVPKLPAPGRKPTPTWEEATLDRARANFTKLKIDAMPFDELGVLFRNASTAPAVRREAKAELDLRRRGMTQAEYDEATPEERKAKAMSPEAYSEALYGSRKPKAPAAPASAPAPAAPAAAPRAPVDFNAVDAAVRKEFAGKTEKEIIAEVVRRMKGG